MKSDLKVGTQHDGNLIIAEYEFQNEYVVITDLLVLSCEGSTYWVREHDTKEYITIWNNVGKINVSSN